MEFNRNFQCDKTLSVTPALSQSEGGKFIPLPVMRTNIQKNRLVIDREQVNSSGNHW